MLDESILTDLIAQSDELYVPPSVPVVLGAGTFTVICAPEPMRLALVVAPRNPADPVFLKLNGSVGAFAIPPGPVNPGKPLVIHAAEFPLMVGLTWYAGCSGGQTVDVYQIIRRS